jgi:hypothetical protein
MPNTKDDKEELERLRKELEVERELRRKAELEAEYWKKRDAKNSEIIARAKNIASVSRPSLSRVKRLCEAACLDVEKVEGGYQLSFGFTLKRVFKKLSHIFDILVLNNWYLSDIFKSNFFAPNKYGYVPSNSSFNNSLDYSEQDSSEPISELKKKVTSVGSLTTSVIHEVISSVVGGTQRFVETVDKYGDIVSQQLSSIPFADSYTDETLNQTQNFYNTWDEALDDFSPA